MITKNKYLQLWRAITPELIQVLNNYKGKTSIQLSKSEFESVGDRKNYSFNLEFINGKVSNNISGSAVARDLSIILSEDKITRETISKGHYKFNLDKQFCLWVAKK
jgi:hypothetical protein